MQITNSIDAPIRSKHLVILIDGEMIRVSYDLSAKVTFGLRVLEAEVRRTVRSHFRRAKCVVEGSNGDHFYAKFLMSSQLSVRKMVADTDRALDKISKKLLSPKMVEEILGISGAERLRWSKDGRLKQAGSATFKKANLVRYFLYSPQVITSILENSETLVTWRTADALVSP